MAAHAGKCAIMSLTRAQTMRKKRRMIASPVVLTVHCAGVEVNAHPFKKLGAKCVSDCGCVNKTGANKS